jgi:hypothetical protein
MAGTTAPHMVDNGVDLEGDSEDYCLPPGRLLTGTNGTPG